MRSAVRVQSRHRSLLLIQPAARLPLPASRRLPVLLPRLVPVRFPKCPSPLSSALSKRLPASKGSSGAGPAAELATGPAEGPAEVLAAVLAVLAGLGQQEANRTPCQSLTAAPAAPPPELDAEERMGRGCCCFPQSYCCSHQKDCLHFDRKYRQRDHLTQGAWALQKKRHQKGPRWK